jgi:very-short-patch-repair endonuclease
VPIRHYIADFLCFEARLIIEVDGGQHCDNSKDAIRDNWFGSQGFRILRVWNTDVLTNLEGVLIEIDRLVRTPHPARRLGGSPPSPTRGEGRTRDGGSANALQGRSTRDA